MRFSVRLHDEFDPEFAKLPEAVQDELLALMAFKAADGMWRVTYAFDPKREAVLLVAGDKSGGGERRFYKQLIAKSDTRYDAHLATLKDD